MSHCPICQKPAVQAYRPFCSKRCADIDLGRWLGGDYRIADPAGTEDAAPGSPGEDGSEERQH